MNAPSRWRTCCWPAAAVGVAVYVIRTPPLRRLAWRLAVTALTATLPAWIGREVQHAWSESGHARDMIVK